MRQYQWAQMSSGGRSMRSSAMTSGKCFAWLDAGRRGTMAARSLRASTSATAL